MININEMSRNNRELLNKYTYPCLSVEYPAAYPGVIDLSPCRVHSVWQMCHILFTLNTYLHVLFISLVYTYLLKLNCLRF